jgi:dihydroflavonol-4-reductase
MFLVTGATGLVGTHLVAALLDAGEKPVRALYRSEEKQKLSIELIRFCYPHLADKLAQIEWHQADILDIDGLAEAFEGVTEVYHTAAFVSFSRRDWKRLYKTNVEGTQNVVNCALDAEVELMVHLSSTSALPRKDDGSPIKEDVPWTREIGKNPYGRTKFMAEREVWRGMEEGLNVIVVNPSVLVGAGNWNESSLEIFRRVHKGLRFYPTGGDAFTDVRDVCRAILGLRQAKLYGQRFMLAGHNTLLKDLLFNIAASLDRRPPTIRVNYQTARLAGRVEGFLAFLTGRKARLNRHTAKVSSTIRTYDSSKVKQALKFEFTPLQESINYAALWYKHALQQGLL